MKTHPLKNWIPYRLFYDQQQWLINWTDLQEIRITAPFFDETISISKYRNRERSSLQSLSNADFLTLAAQEILHLKPTAFIFHVSRCGSTLLSQAFSEEAENIVIAEAPLLDEILRSAEKDPEISVEQQEKWFKASLDLMGQFRNAKESDYIIKLDSWHIHFYSQLRNWFPDTPFLFLFRNPEAVIASHDKRRGMHAVPGLICPSLLKIDKTKDYQGNLNHYTADVMQQYYLELLDIHAQKHPFNTFADYADGVWQMVSLFSEVSGIEIRNRKRIEQRLTYSSKFPKELFKKESIPDPKFSYPQCHEAYQRLRQAILTP